MTLERLRITFRFRRGDIVRWAACPDTRWIVLRQRYTTRELMGPVLEYGLAEAAETQPGPLRWALEPDIIEEP